MISRGDGACSSVYPLWRISTPRTPFLKWNLSKKEKEVDNLTYICKIHRVEEITTENDDKLERRTQNSPRASEFCSLREQNLENCCRIIE